MSNIDKIIKQSLADNLISQRVEQRFSEGQLEEIIKNIIDGHINRCIADRVHHIAINKLDSMIRGQFEDRLNKDETIEDIKYECKKYTRSHNFYKNLKCYFSENVNHYLGKWLESYQLYQVTEKYLSEIKSLSEEEKEMQESY